MIDITINRPADPAPNEAEDGEYRPLTEEEMEAELDQLDEEDDADDEAPEEASGKGSHESAEEAPYEVPTDFVPDAVDNKLEWVMTLRDEGRYDEARTVLYEVLVEGNEAQIKVARNILAQLDE